MSAPSWEPLVLTVAPNGARKTKKDHPRLPLTPAELADTAAACRDAGAAMIHLHVRDDEAGHSLDCERYRAAIEAIRGAVGESLIIQVTSEAVGLYSAEQQMAMVRDLRPEAVSLSVREIVPDSASEKTAAAFFEWLSGSGILPQYILYDDADLRRFDDLVGRGVIPEAPIFLLYVLGRYSAGQQSEPNDLLPFLAAASAPHSWALCAFGAKEVACVSAAAALGGHARVGFENNLLLPDGQVAADNAAAVAATAQAVRSIGRPLADADEARQLMGKR